MKRLLLVLGLLSVVTEAAWCQGIWHEGLGTPPSGSVTLDSGATSFTVLAPSPLSGADLGAIFSGIYHALAASEIDWCFLSDLSRTSSGVLLTFITTANDNPFSGRSLVIGDSYMVNQPVSSSAGTGIVFPGLPVVHVRTENYTYDASGNRTGSTVTSN